jgi:hypothetical protein
LSFAFFAAFVCSVVPVANAQGADVYFGYSRVGNNLYAANTPGMNGWQAAAHIKPFHFVGIEGDVSHYGQKGSGFTQQVTLAMIGPRITVHAAGVNLFAHGIAGIAHESATVTIYPSVGYDATSYAFGGGADLPLFVALKLRATGDYLGNSEASLGNSPSHYRLGVGVAYHFPNLLRRP